MNIKRHKYLSRRKCRYLHILQQVVESSWNVVAQGDAREGKWRGNWRMEWVASTLQTTSNMVYPALLPLMRTTRLPVVDWTDAPADLKGLVRFAERGDLVSACVSSHFNWPLHIITTALYGFNRLRVSKLIKCMNGTTRYDDEHCLICYG